MIKKITYIALFTLLGIFVQFLLHAVIEIWYIGLLLKDFTRFSLGYSWETWFLIHHVGSVILFLAGAGFGFWQGIFWWGRIYGQK